MKLNYDCVRDLLLTIEELSGLDANLFDKRIRLSEVSKAPYMAKYSEGEIVYTSRKLKEANFIDFFMHNIDLPNNIITYGSLTFTGHQFLDSIRQNTIWESTKIIASKAGSITIDLISQIAKEILLSTIKSLTTG